MRHCSAEDAPITVGIIVKVPGYGAILGCDSRVTGGNAEILCDEDEKWLVAGSAVACCAGTLGGVWADLRERPPRNWKGLREAFKVAGVSFESLVYDRKTDRLWHSDNAGDALDRGMYATIGCGGGVAMGVLDAHEAPTTLEEGHALVTRALEITCRRNSACGGRLRVLTIPLSRRRKIVVD